MKTLEIGIKEIGDICLRKEDDYISIFDNENGGEIRCRIENIRRAISVINRIYKNRNALDEACYGYNRDAIQMAYYQDTVGINVFRSNFILIKHMPDIIKMLKSIKIEKKKFILNKDELLGLDIDSLTYLKQTMKRRKKVLINEEGYKYIEV